MRAHIQRSRRRRGGSDPEKDRPTSSEPPPSSSSPVGGMGARLLGSAESHGVRVGGGKEEARAGLCTIAGAGVGMGEQAAE
jgi:hypothetical protein